MAPYGPAATRVGRWTRHGSSIVLLDPMIEEDGPELERAAGGVDVRWVQTALNSTLGLRLAVDGKVGPQTRSALRTFQASRGLPASGIADPPTLTALQQAMASQAAVGHPLADLSGFAFDDHRLQPHHLPLIEQVAHAVARARTSERPLRALRIVGHTDRVGDDAYNMALGLRRANEVQRALSAAIDRVSPGRAGQLRFIVESRGEADPHPTGREASRRVQVVALTQAPKPPPPKRRPPKGGGGGGVAKEHVIVVGAPSNFYNGFGRIDAAGNFVLNPAPKTLGEVRDFCHPSLGNVTHDVYWANFIEPVPRLFTTGRAKPVDGDVVTLLVYWPPYAQRSERDWDSSPWNAMAWRTSPWVAGKDPYDPTVRSGLQGTFRPPSVPTVPKTSPKTKLDFSKQAVSEARIDHEILMRCTTETKRPGQTYDMRPSRPSEWLDDVHDLARRIVFGPMLGGTPVLPNVLVKLLIVDNPKQILDYLTAGTFPSGNRWTHLLDTHDEEDMANMQGPDLGDREGQWWDVAAARKKGFKPPPYWTAPHISRKQVKVKRLDYFGHSNADACFLKYGCANAKGDPAGPVGEVLLSKQDLDAALKTAPQPVFSASATAHLWGCSLGLGMAGVLQNYVTTVAAEVLTDYEGLVLDPRAMPQPVGGGWVTYLKPVSVRAR